MNNASLVTTHRILNDH